MCANKIRSNSKHPLYGALPRQHVPLRIACGDLVVQRYTLSIFAVVPKCLFVKQSSDPLIDGAGLEMLKSKNNVFFLLA